MVLLFGTMGEIGEVVKKDLLDKGVEVVLEDFPQNTFRDEWGYRRNLSKAVAKYSPRVIIPIGHSLALARLREGLPIAATSPIGSLRDGLPQEIIIPISSAEIISLLDSKVRSSALATKLGIPQPQLFNKPEDAPSARTIFKRDRSFGGSGVYRPKTLDSLINLINHEPGSPYLIEEYIEGEDISVDCIRMNGEFHAQCYQSLSKCQGQGPSVERKVIECSEVVKYARKILDAVDYYGVCGMDFRRNLKGEVFFLECNPRMSGGIRTQIESGFDIPWIYYNLSVNSTPSNCLGNRRISK